MCVVSVLQLLLLLTVNVEYFLKQITRTSHAMLKTRYWITTVNDYFEFFACWMSSEVPCV